MPRKRKDWQEVALGEYMEDIEEEMSASIGGQVPVVKHWAQIVGPQLAENSQLESIDAQRMVVKCTHPAYASWFRINQSQILARLRELHPELDVRRISVFS